MDVHVCAFVWLWTHNVAKDNFEVLIILILHPKYLGYKCALPSLKFALILCLSYAYIFNTNGKN